MLRLFTFGGLELKGDGRALGAAAGQKKPLALLAALAGSGARGLSRERIAALLWPESDSQQAGNLLRQRLFHLRRDLDAPDIITGTVQLQLNPEVISSDAGDFERAITHGDPAGAIELYIGPFLDGYHLAEAPEFERWVAERRDYFASQAKSAMLKLADDPSATGTERPPADRLLRLSAIEPYDAAIAMRLMNELASSGDYASALKHGQTYEARMRDDLGVSASPELVAMNAKLRRELRASIVPVNTAVDKLNDQITSLPEAGADAHPKRNRSNRTAMISIAGAAMSALIVLGVKQSGGSEKAPAQSATTLAIFPFDLHGDTAYSYLKEGIPHLLNIRLNGAGTVRAVDMRSLAEHAGSDTLHWAAAQVAHKVAARVGAGTTVVGRLVESGGKLQLVVTVHGSDKETAHLAAEGAPTDLPKLVDQLAAQILASIHTRPSERLSQAATTMTSSFVALKAFLIGEREFRAGRYPAAADAFRQAVIEDTTFALAYYRLAVAAESAPWHPAAIDSAAERAVHFAGQLAPRERQLIAAFLGRRRGDYDEAQRRYRIVLGWYPDEVEAWSQLAEIQFHYDPVRGEPLSASKPAYEKVLRIRPNDQGALVHLLRMAAHSEDVPAVDSLSQKLTQLSPANAGLPQFQLFRAAAMRDTPAIESNLTQLSNAGEEVLAVTARHLATYARDIPTALRVATLLTDKKRELWYRIGAYESQSILFVALGQLRNSQRALQSHDSFHDDWAIELRGLIQALPFLPIDRAGIDTIRQALVKRRPIRPMKLDRGPAFAAGVDERVGLFALGLLAVRVGDTAAAHRYARDTENANGAPGEKHIQRVLANTIRAEVARSSSDYSGALELLGDERPVGTLGDLGGVIGSQVYQRFLRAELLREQGRLRDALRWYSSLVQTTSHETLFLAPSHLRQAEILEKLGEHDRAAGHYRRFASLWSNCDPILRPMVQNALNRAKTLESR